MIPFVCLALITPVFVGSVYAVPVMKRPEPVVREHFVYDFDNPAFIPIADTTLKIARQQLIDLLQDSLDYKAKIHIVEDLDYFRSLIRGRFPDWGAAAAYPPRELIAIKSPDRYNLGKSLPELLAHEYSHLVLAKRTGFYQAPRWFSEGVAMLISTEWSWSDNLAMSKAAVFGSFVKLSDIEIVNRFNDDRARVAYAESYLAVKYFYNSYDRRAVNIFLDEIARDASIDEALMASVGSDYKGFEDEFNMYLKKHYNIVTLFTDTMWFWLGLAILLVVGSFMSYRRRREYYKKWEQDEQLHSTDFDYGDPDNPEVLDDDEPWRH